MRKAISTEYLTDTLHISECHDGWWLYDKTRGMYLGMRAKTKEAAFIECITYYQRRLSEVERAHRSLSDRVNAFVEQFKDDEEEGA